MRGDGRAGEGRVTFSEVCGVQGEGLHGLEFNGLGFRV